MSRTTLGGGHPHIFVTRAATLQFQEFQPRPFEEARRELTRLLLDAVPVRGDARRWWFYAPDGAPLIAYVVPRDGLLMVAHVRLAEDAPEAHIPGPPVENHAGRWDRFLRDGGMSLMQEEIQILRAALHSMAAAWIADHSPPAYVFQDTQAYVDYYVAKERTK